MSLAAVVCLGAAGYVAMGWSVADAFYMVVITVSSVGFGEVRPVDSTYLRIHTMMVIALGMVAAGDTIAGILRFVTEEELSKLTGQYRVRRMIDALSDHTIVAGLGRMGSLVCEELAAAGEPFVVIDQAPEKMAAYGGRNWLFVAGDATEESVLLDAGLERAKALVTAIPNDASSVFITLTARQLNAKVQIVARAERATTQKKLRQAGANHVVLPAAIGAHRVVSILTNPSAVEFAELVTHRSSLAIEMDEVAVKSPGPLVGKTLRDLDIGRKTGVIVVAIKRVDGRVEFPPNGDEPLAAADSIVLLGRRSNLVHFREEFRG
ncbi:MAG: transport system, NAD-binding component [Planctomycetota bacterium]|nr:transport system, NAD-binding component [Planctomycetota bacterium]